MSFVDEYAALWAIKELNGLCIDGHNIRVTHGRKKYIYEILSLLSLSLSVCVCVCVCVEVIAEGVTITNI